MMWIKRDVYLNRLIERMGNGQVKIITGTRRCGKSFLLFELFCQYLSSRNVPSGNIVRVMLDDIRCASLRNPLALIDHIEHQVSGDGTYYVLIDEIQLCQRIANPAVSGAFITFYDVLNSLLRKRNLDIYIIGSNSRMLSSDILTEFRGGGDEIRLYPLSFAEFFAARGGNREEALDEYMLFGGMPQVLQYASAQSKSAYLADLFSQTYLRDIIERGGVRRTEILSEITDCLCSATGSLTNVHRLANTVNSQRHAQAGQKVSDALIAGYIDQLVDAYLFNRAARYDVKG